MILALGVVAISWGGPLVRFTTAPSLTVAAWRLALAALALLPFGLRGWRRNDAPFAILAGFFLAAHFASWIQSLRLTSVASSVVLVSTSPLFVGLFSFLLGEKPGRAFWLGVSTALLGTILIGLDDLSISQEAALGDLLALVGAVAAAGYLLLGRRARKTMKAIPYASLAYLSAALLLVLCARAFSTLVPPKTDWPWLILIALVPQVLGHTTVNWALGRLPAFAVAMVVLGEPVGAALWAHLLFHETLSPLQGLGMILVLFGIFWGLRALRE